MNTETYIHLAMAWYYNRHPHNRGLRFEDLKPDTQEIVLRRAHRLQMDDDTVRLHTLNKRTTIEVI